MHRLEADYAPTVSGFSISVMRSLRNPELKAARSSWHFAGSAMIIFGPAREEGIRSFSYEQNS
jgi:hypothetical protein